MGMDGATNVFIKKVSLCRNLCYKLKKILGTLANFWNCRVHFHFIFQTFGYFQGDLDIQVSQIRSESRLHVEEGDIHLRLSDAHPLKVGCDHYQ